MQHAKRLAPLLGKTGRRCLGVLIAPIDAYKNNYNMLGGSRSGRMRAATEHATAGAGTVLRCGHAWRITNARQRRRTGDEQHADPAVRHGCALREQVLVTAGAWIRLSRNSGHWNN